MTFRVQSVFMQILFFLWLEYCVKTMYYTGSDDCLKFINGLPKHCTHITHRCSQKILVRFQFIL